MELVLDEGQPSIYILMLMQMRHNNYNSAREHNYYKADDLPFAAGMEKVIHNLKSFFEREAKYGQTIAAHRVMDRMVAATGLSKRALIHHLNKTTKPRISAKRVSTIKILSK